MSTQALARGRSPEWRSDLQWLGVSVALRAIVVASLLGISGIDPRTLFRPTPKPEERWKAKPKPQAAASDAETLIEVRPFEGISWEEFTKRRADRSRQSSTANAVLAKLKGLKFGSGTGGAVAEKGTPSAAAPIEIRSSTGASLGALVGRQEYAVRRAEIDTKSGARKMTDAERAELKKRFRELEREFRKAFAEALNDDPELRVTVSFESEIGADGKLAVRTFRAKGRYRPASLEKLKTAMRQGIGNVRLAPDLAGTVVRGESVFVK